MRGVEEQVLREQAALRGYSTLHAQHTYVHVCASLPSHGLVFFPCKVGQPERLTGGASLSGSQGGASLSDSQGGGGGGSLSGSQGGGGGQPEQ